MPDECRLGISIGHSRFGSNDRLLSAIRGQIVAEWIALAAGWAAFGVRAALHGVRRVVVDAAVRALR